MKSFTRLFVLSVLCNLTAFSCWAQSEPLPLPKVNLQQLPQKIEMPPQIPSSTAVSPLGTQFAQTQVLLINRQYPEAITGFQSILSTQPDYIPALSGLAMAFYHQGRYEEALGIIEKAMSLDPVNSSLFYTQARIKDAQNKPIEALQSYLAFTALNPDDATIVEAQRRAGELYKMVEKQLSPAEQLIFQGERLLSLRQPTEAIELLKQYQSLRPDDTQAQLMMGQAYLELGQPEKAVPQFESAVKQKADNAAAYYQLGNSYDLQGQSQNAKQAYQQFLKYAPQSEAAVLLKKKVGGQL